MVSILICSTNSNNYKKPAYDNGFYAKSHFVDNVCCSITNNETSRNCSISAPVRLTSRAKLLSQMNPIAGSMSVDSRSVEIQASRPSREKDGGLEATRPTLTGVISETLVLRPEIQRCGSERSPHHARQTELDLPGYRSGDATECDCALTDLTPGGKIALVAGSFALEIFDSGECRLAQVRDLHRVYRLDDLLQDGLDIGGLPGRLAPEYRQQRGIMGSIAREGEFRHAADSELVGVLPILRPGQHAKDTLHRSIRSGRKIIAPQGVEHLRGCFEPDGLWCLVASEEITDRCRIALELVERRWTGLERDCVERRQLPGRVFLDHQL